MRKVPSMRRRHSYRAPPPSPATKPSTAWAISVRTAHRFMLSAPRVPGSGVRCSPSAWPIVRYA
jgi:hypothetical protein